MIHSIENPNNQRGSGGPCPPWRRRKASGESCWSRPFRAVRIHIKEESLCREIRGLPFCAGAISPLKSKLESNSQISQFNDPSKGHPTRPYKDHSNATFKSQEVQDLTCSRSRLGYPSPGKTGACGNRPPSAGSGPWILPLRPRRRRRRRRREAGRLPVCVSPIQRWNGLPWGLPLGVLLGVSATLVGPPQESPRVARRVGAEAGLLQQGLPCQGGWSYRSMGRHQSR